MDKFFENMPGFPGAGGTGQTLSPEQANMLKNCVAMLERYYDKVASTGKAVPLEGKDRDDWLNRYYPALVQGGPRIPDDLFFYPDGSHPNFGIGNDALMTKYDYCNFLYRAYKLLLGPITPGCMVCSPRAPILYNTAECLFMLEPYLEKFRRNAFDGLSEISVEEQKRWKEYYEQLVCKGILPDGSFFREQPGNDNLGIGRDGKFTGCELMHFLYECVKFLYNNLR